MSISRRLSIGSATLLTIAAALPAAATASTTPLEAEGLGLSPSSAGTSFTDSAASGGRARLLWSNGAVTTTTTGAISTVTVRAKGDQCSGAPTLAVAVDGKTVATQPVTQTSWTDQTVALPQRLAAGSHAVSLAFTNDTRTSSCDRNLRVDEVRIDDGTKPRLPLYVDPYSKAQVQADAWRSSRPADAAAIDKIADQPQAIWLGGYSGDSTALNRALSGAAATGTEPVFSIYGIPHRDGGQYSSGGFPNAAAYKAWIDWIATTIGDAPATLVVEPDATAMSMATADLQSERWSLLSYATQRLGALPNARVYLDAGNSAWKTVASITSRLQSAGVQYADGFALNVSNFLTTSSQVAYGQLISTALGGNVPFVIDTSRNGNGPVAGATGEAAWCNPANRSVGARPTLTTGTPGVDGYLWVKRPGESDGTCNGGPSSGTFWGDYAVGLATRAAW